MDQEIQEMTRRLEEKESQNKFGSQSKNLEKVGGHRL
jgi:hypothetical protein